LLFSQIHGNMFFSQLYTFAVFISACSFHYHSIDFDSFEKQIDYVLKSGAHGICVNALLGEGYKLTEEERKQVLEFTVKKIGGRVPIVEGIQVNSSYMAINLAKQSKNIGSAALMITPPFLYTPNLKNIFEYFKAISDAVDVDLMVQDAAALVGLSIGVETMKKMVLEIKNIKYLKLELCKPGPEVSVYTDIFKDRCPLIWGYAA
jgi:dihydrodipicolinate synthase/N-acetylneuraminate lyase